MARYSFAMGNAAENIKQIARYATHDNNHERAETPFRRCWITHPL